MGKLRVAFEGCCHGELNKIYSQIKYIEEKTTEKVDLLIICGDFQSIRNVHDLDSLACPPKYRQMGDFEEYYLGRKVAPIPTLFIGGNHEASNHLWELYYGGWVAPNIYYLGGSGVIWFRGLRIGGLSGIYHPHHYKMNYNEKVPYDNSTMRSIYHTRHYEIQKLSTLGLSSAPCAKAKLDVVISHDWPQSIYHYGNIGKLLKIKPYFREEINREELGSPVLKPLLQSLKPKYWVSGHLHVKFVAKVNHQRNAALDPQEIYQLEKCFNELIAKPDTLNNLTGSLQEEEKEETIFLALDKCLPRRSFLQVIEMEENKEYENRDLSFYYDAEWLQILTAFNPNFPIASNLDGLRGDLDIRKLDEVDPIQETDLKITENNFELLPDNWLEIYKSRPQAWNNPQTVKFCNRFGLTNFPWILQESL